MIRKIDDRIDRFFLVMSCIFVTMTVFYPLVAPNGYNLCWAIDTANQYFYIIILNSIISFTLINNKIRVFSYIISLFVLFMAIYEISYVFNQERNNLYWQLAIGIYWITVAPLIYYFYVRSTKSKG